MSFKRRGLRAAVPMACAMLVLCLAQAAYAAPANDNFANATKISGSLLREGAPGSTKEATKEAGEPNHAGDPGGASVWYHWTPSESQVAAFTTCGGFDTVIGVYTGAAVNALTEVGSNDNTPTGGGPACGSPASEVRVPVSAGVKYMIAVDGKGGATGTVKMRIFQRPGNDDFADSETLPLTGVKFTPSNWLATAEAGEPEHGGVSGGASVWYHWTPVETGTVTLDNCGGGSGPDTVLAVYTGTELGALTPIASNDNGAGECAPQSEVTFEAVAFTKYKIAVDGVGGDEGYFNFDLTP
ncbi:MAG TPA: hypothetical protein VFY48_10125 [Solirubrobacterales bacterium]|nr:hypothetical protein [Solirubrobacterales bacterium]